VTRVQTSTSPLVCEVLMTIVVLSIYQNEKKIKEGVVDYLITILWMETLLFLSLSLRYLNLCIFSYAANTIVTPSGGIS